MTSQVAQDLRAAAEVLRRDGWTQGQYRNHSGQCCVRGAVHLAVHGDTPHPSARTARALWALEDHLIHIGVGVEMLGASGVIWNDDPSRTADEVIAALEAAADAAEASDA